ncbi:MAG: fatty acid desaturase [Candidatus Woesearchaeota archaeon]|nr:fatty acid desaturase [Candidatus Woesearchaeota archaeon]
MVGKLNWTNTIFFGSYHLLLLILLPIYLLFFEQHLGLWLSMLVLVGICGVAITAGYHRFYAHRSYQLHPIAEIPLLFLGTLTIQGSVLKWASDHRLHHRHVDTEKDPYCIEKGFWHAHFIWIIEQSATTYNPKVVHDLVKRKLLVLQDKHYLACVIASNALVLVLFGWLFGSLFGAFVVMFLTRLFINHHTTWFINSLAHTWGVQPFSREHSAVNNWVISLLTYGEGYHNYHHTFANDYRNGVRWWQFDPGKFVIWSLSKIGLASNLRRVDRSLITEKLLAEDKKLLLEKVKEIGYVKLEALEADIHKKADALHEKIAAFKALVHEYQQVRKQKVKAKQLKKKMKVVKRSIRADLRAWGKFCDNVLAMKPSLA